MMIDPQNIGIVSTGVYLIIPPGYTGFIQPKLGITPNSVFLVWPGTIGSSYRGIVWWLVQTMLFNCNKTKGHISQKWIKEIFHVSDIEKTAS